jgi:hypothetical protein
MIRENRGADTTRPGHPGNPEHSARMSSAEIEEEARKLRRLQLMMNMVTQVICGDENLTVEEAAELVAGTRRAALALFPGKELAYDLLYKPRLQRLMNERFRLQ